MTLTRSDDDKWIAGVCGGLAQAFGIESQWIRLGFALFAIFGGASVAIYIVLWIVMPRPGGGTIAQDAIKKGKDWYDENQRPKGTTED